MNVQMDAAATRSRVNVVQRRLRHGSVVQRHLSPVERNTLPDPGSSDDGDNSPETRFPHLKEAVRAKIRSRQYYRSAEAGADRSPAENGNSFRGVSGLLKNDIPLAQRKNGDAGEVPQDGTAPQPPESTFESSPDAPKRDVHPDNTPEPVPVLIEDQDTPPVLPGLKTESSRVQPAEPILPVDPFAVDLDRVDLTRPPAFCAPPLPEGVAPFFSSHYTLNFIASALMVEPAPPPLVIGFSVTPESAVPLSSYLEVTVRNPVTGSVLAKEGYDFLYSRDLCKHMVLTTPGPFHITLFGKRIDVELELMGPE